MSATPPTDDHDLRNLLRTWEVEPHDDPALARRVWARIEADEPRPFAAPGWIENLARLFARPVAAVGAVALFMVVGGAAAEFQNFREREAQVTRLAAEYARSIDPILMTHPVDHAGHVP